MLSSSQTYTNLVSHHPSNRKWDNEVWDLFSCLLTVPLLMPALFWAHITKEDKAHQFLGEKCSWEQPCPSLLSGQTNPTEQNHPQSPRNYNQLILLNSSVVFVFLEPNFDAFYKSPACRHLLQLGKKVSKVNINLCWIYGIYPHFIWQWFAAHLWLTPEFSCASCIVCLMHNEMFVVFSDQKLKH